MAFFITLKRLTLQKFNFLFILKIIVESEPVLQVFSFCMSLWVKQSIEIFRAFPKANNSVVCAEFTTG